MAEYWELQWPDAGQPLFVHAPSALADPDGRVTVGQWLRQLRACYLHCRQLSARSVALYQPDSLQCSLWLLALLQAGKTVILAPNASAETQQHCLQHADLNWCGDLPLPAVDAEPEPDRLVLQLPLNSALGFMTSGSTGAPKLVQKQLWQLRLEVQTLQHTFGQSWSGPALYGATVSHQHIYGLLFRLLWPLSCGAVLAGDTIQYEEQWQALCRHQLPVILISSPAHISRFKDSAMVSTNGNRFVAVFSSGGPLAESDAASFYRQTGLGPIEVYGSTETGGIGWRQYPGDLPVRSWQAFDGMQLSLTEEQCLQLLSPYLGDALTGTADLAALLSGQRFVLRGRADRIVKLEEKRLALAEVEQLCLRLPQVRHCVALLLKPQAPHRRTQLALVVALSDEGWLALQQQGKLALVRDIKHQLAQRFETVLLPRRFRFVRQLPYNAQGKLPLQGLEALFQ